MLTPEIIEYFKTTALEKLERLTLLGLTLELAGHPRNLTEENYFSLLAEFEDLKNLYWVVDTVLNRHEAFTQVLPAYLNYSAGLNPEGLERLRKARSQAAERLLVLGLMLEVAGTHWNLTIEDYTRLREEIEMLKELIVSCLQLEVKQQQGLIYVIAFEVAS